MNMSDSYYNECIDQVKAIVAYGSKERLIQFYNMLIAKYDDGYEQAQRLDRFYNHKWSIF